ncbi:MAG: hypothetical protein H6601_05100 [Flavobacteriales bacterium]|nr:hypothetical protein [Flavobacteriales bacterium]
MLWKDRLKRLYWKIDPSVGEVIFQRSSKPFSDQRPSFSDPRVNKAFHLDNVTWEHEEFIVKVNNALVEPDLGYAIQGYRTIVGSSKKKGRFGLPSPKPIWKSRFNEKPRKLECAILLMVARQQLLLLFAAVLHKIYLLEEHLAIGKTPIIVGKGTFTKKYFRNSNSLTISRN